MNNKKSIYGHLSNEADLVQMKSLKPANKYNRLNFSFKCSECGKISSRNLCTIVFPFICRNCVSKQTHTTDEYYANYNKSMVEKYGENYREILDEHRNQVVKERYGSYSGMFIATSDKRNATMKARYGVTHPAKIDGYCRKCAETKLQRYGDPTYNNRDKAKESIVVEFGSTDAWYQQNVIKSAHTKLIRYGDKTYNNREKAAKTSLKRYGVRVPSQSKKIHERMHFKYIYNDIIFDSSYDLSYYIWLSDNNIDFEYRPDVQFSYTYNGRTHVYNPDFRVELRLVELKGRQFFKDKNPDNVMVNPYNHDEDGLYEAKHQCMLAHNVDIIVDCSEYEKYVAEHYGKDYISTFRNKTIKHKKRNKVCNELQQD